MGNSLNRDLKAGDRVVLEGGETVVVGEPLMFGAMASTTGQALCVLRTGSPTGIRVSGYDIDAAATMARHAVDNGWQEDEPKPVKHVPFRRLEVGEIKQAGDQYFDGQWRPIPEDVIGMQLLAGFAHRRPLVASST